MCTQNAKIALHALHLICLFALFGLGCALTAMGLNGDGAYGAKVLLAGIVLFFVTFIVIATYKCKIHKVRSSVMHVLVRISLGLSLSMILGGGFLAAGAKLVNGTSNNKILWAFVAFGFLFFVFTFSSRSLLCILFYWFNIDRMQCKAFLLDTPFVHATINGVAPWELCQVRDFPTHDRAQAAAASLVRRLQFNYQLPC